MSEKKRLISFDILKLLALFAVFNSHFVAEYAMNFKENPSIGHLLNGFTGKFGVILFALLAGYFSYRSSKKSELGPYLLKRYLFFFSCCLIADVSFYLLNVNGARENSSLGMVISQIVLLGDYYCDTFWFIRDFLIGSLFSFLIGKYHLKKSEILLIILALFYMKQPFVASYVAGCLLYELQDHSFVKKPLVKILLLVYYLVFFLVYRKESNLVYFEDLTRALSLSLLAKQLDVRLNAKAGLVLEKLSSMSMALIIGHVLAFHICNVLLLSEKLNIVVLYFFWLLITFVSGILFELAIRLVNKCLLALSGKIEALL